MALSMSFQIILENYFGRSSYTQTVLVLPTHFDPSPRPPQIPPEISEPTEFGNDKSETDKNPADFFEKDEVEGEEPTISEVLKE